MLFVDEKLIIQCAKNWHNTKRYWIIRCGLD